MPIEVVLKAFWPSAYTSPFFERNIEYFGSLFNTPEVEYKYDVVEIWSLFGDKSIPPPKGEGEERTLRVQFSGEGYYFNPKMYGASLIPALEALGVVSHPLAGMHIHGNNFMEYLQRPRVWDEALHDTKRFCSFVVSNGGPQERKYFFNRLSAFKTVDSCGRFCNNWGRAIPDPDSAEYLQFLSNFRFMLAFENKRVDNYMTEKIINAYVGGSIPIYWGCPQATELLNPEAFLMLDEEASVEGFERLFEKVVALENDKEAYKRMFEQPLFKESAAMHPSMTIEYLQQSVIRALQLPPVPEPELEPVAEPSTDIEASSPTPSQSNDLLLD